VYYGKEMHEKRRQGKAQVQRQEGRKAQEMHEARYVRRKAKKVQAVN
jgi:hypothetical protein